MNLPPAIHQVVEIMSADNGFDYTRRASIVLQDYDAYELNMAAEMAISAQATQVDDTVASVAYVLAAGDQRDQDKICRKSPLMAYLHKFLTDVVERRMP